MEEPEDDFEEEAELNSVSDPFALYKVPKREKLIMKYFDSVLLLAHHEVHPELGIELEEEEILYPNDINLDIGLAAVFDIMRDMVTYVKVVENSSREDVFETKMYYKYTDIDIEILFSKQDSSRFVFRFAGENHLYYSGDTDLPVFEAFLSLMGIMFYKEVLSEIHYRYHLHISDISDISDIGKDDIIPFEPASIAKAWYNKYLNSEETDFQVLSNQGKIFNVHRSIFDYISDTYFRETLSNKYLVVNKVELDYNSVTVSAFTTYVYLGIEGFVKQYYDASTKSISLDPDTVQELLNLADFISSDDFFGAIIKCINGNDDYYPIIMSYSESQAQNNHYIQYKKKYLSSKKLGTYHAEEGKRIFHRRLRSYQEKYVEHLSYIGHEGKKFILKADITNKDNSIVSRENYPVYFWISSKDTKVYYHTYLNLNKYDKGNLEKIMVSLFVSDVQEKTDIEKENYDPRNYKVQSIISLFVENDDEE